MSEFWQETAKHGKQKLPSPCYVFDADVLGKTVQQIRDLMPACNALCFAVKANPFLIESADRYVDRYEVCSPGEYEISLAHKIDPSKLIISGVHKTYESMKRIIDTCGNQSIFTVESPRHYQILRQISEEMQLHLKLMIRLSSGNQFGVDEETLKHIFDENADSRYCSIIGIHYFSGTQKRLKKIHHELEYLNQFGAEIKEQYGLQRLELEYGPGLAVNYFESSRNPAPEEELRELNQLLQSMDSFDFIGIEMGRFIAADCGCFITQVDDIKTTDNADYLILDSGIHQLNYFGQMMGMEIPHVKQLNLREGKPSKAYTIFGALCTVNDVLVRNIELQEPEIGDRLLFQKCGAYSVTECSALFLSRDLPSVYVYSSHSGYTCLRKRFETYQLNTNL